MAKSLFFGGVTRRFPSLNFGFLECGAAWACSLFSDIVGHYEKRSLSAMEYVDPKNLDVDKLMQYFDDYANLNITTKILTGKPAEALAHYIESSGADLLVMATHGRSGPSRWVLGGVADRLLQVSSVPIFVALFAVRWKEEMKSGLQSGYPE